MKQIPLDKAYRILNPGAVQIVASKHKDRESFCPVAWITPVEREPVMFAVSLSNEGFTRELVEESGALTVSTPTTDVVDRVFKAGKISGREIDKFKEIGFERIPSKILPNYPLLKGCAAYIEGYVRTSVPMRTHTVYIVEVVYAQADEKFFSDRWDLEKVELISHIGGKDFGVLKKLIW